MRAQQFEHEASTMAVAIDATQPQSELATTAAQAAATQQE
jgi:hypothetical protein